MNEVEMWSNKKSLLDSVRIFLDKIFHFPVTAGGFANQNNNVLTFRCLEFLTII